MNRGIGILVIGGGICLVRWLPIYSGGFNWFGRLPGDIRYEGERTQLCADRVMCWFDVLSLIFYCRKFLRLRTGQRLIRRSGRGPCPASQTEPITLVNGSSLGGDRVPSYLRLTTLCELREPICNAFFTQLPQCLVLNSPPHEGAKSRLPAEKPET